MPSNEDLEQATFQAALEHSRAWITLHANQRQNLLNFYLIAVAFLFNAYVSGLDYQHNEVAAIISIVGVLVSVGFMVMDRRNRELTRAGEAPMKILEDRLASILQIPSIRITESVERPRYPWMSMGKLIRAIHATVGVVFVGAFIYAVYQ